ncbi:MAG: colanic acid/amylovoran biosynthesis glycosyltransferase [Psychroserpens sp.]
MKNIAIISPNKNAYSETFIKAHIKYLRGNIHYIYGGFPFKTSDKKGSLLSYYHKYNFFSKVIKFFPVFIYNRLFYKSHSDYFEFYLKREKIDIVLADDGLTGALNLSVIKKLKIPLITYFFGGDSSIRSTLETNFKKYNDMFVYAEKVLVVSNEMKERIIDLGCKSSKIIVNQCPPNDMFFKIQPNFSKKQFLAIGRFVDIKAPYFTILAFSKIAIIHDDARLIILGDGPLLYTCKNLAKYLNVIDKIDFRGVVPQEEYKSLFAESLAFVQHSITIETGDMEGTPVAILEASASGLPVISTNHAGIPEVIINEKTGLLVEETDVNGMSKNMIKVIDNVDYAKKLGAAGKDFVKKNFRMKNHIKIIQDLIDM